MALKVKHSVAATLALLCTMGVAQAANLVAGENGDTPFLSGSQFDVATFTTTSITGETATGSGAFIANTTATGSALVVLTEGVNGPASDWLLLTYSGSGSTERITANWNSDSETGGLPPIPVLAGVTPQFLAETGGSQDVTALLALSAGGNFPSNITVQVQSDTVEAAVPEPSTWAMMITGFALMSFVGYRRTRRGRISALA